ncbi:MAG: response regulator receiver protein [Chthoniobacteraceae bacterium]|nr:response regulator receiver protein [Chthoniobacteraceae bacterium]
MNRAPQHDFWLQTARVAFSNPFDEEFKALLPQIETDLSGRVSKLDQAGATHLRRYRAEERATMRTVFLFDTYRRFQPELDRLVAEQNTKSDATVPFADELLSLLGRRGIEGEEAQRAFAIFFQIRRAHSFIGEGLAGQSDVMKTLRRHLWNNVFTHDMHIYERSLWDRMDDFSTLLIGETGTGKGTAAAAIGRSRFIPFDTKKQCFAESVTRGFVSLNLSQYPDTLIESELFGHRKGAFPGAVEAHEGLFARCSPFGTIFLDEIGELAAPIQSKLLGVLNNRVFSPVGSHEEIPFRGRLIAATHRTDLKGRFRDDFYYRLCSNAITLPTLRERLAEEPRELDQLLEHLVARIGGDAAIALLPIVRAALSELIRSNYRWPGNVRELEQSVRRIILTRTHPGGASAAVPDQLSELQAGVAAGSLDADALLSAYCALLYTRHGNLEEVARRTNLDRRTVKRYLGVTARKR